MQTEGAVEWKTEWKAEWKAEWRAEWKAEEKLDQKAERKSDRNFGGPEKRPIRTRESAGLILCRVNPTTQRHEVALVLKRYTYAFSNFLLGAYTAENTEEILALFNKMTLEERTDVWSLNFGQMWFRVWLTSSGEKFAKKYRKFESCFLRDKGAHRGAHLGSAQGRPPAADRKQNLVRGAGGRGRASDQKERL